MYFYLKMSNALCPLELIFMHLRLQDIVSCAVSESSKSSRDDRIVYRNFTEKEVEVDMA